MSAGYLPAGKGAPTDHWFCGLVGEGLFAHLGFRVLARLPPSVGV
jgi:hypothetical protein